MDFADLAHLGEPVARARRIAFGVDRRAQRGDELGPLLGVAVDGDQALVRALVAAIGGEDLLVAHHGEVRPIELLGVPAGGVPEQGVAIGRREGPALDGLGEGREDLVPERLLALGEPLDLLGHGLVAGQLAERPRIREDSLVRVLELGGAQAPDLREDARQLFARLRGLAARDERLDELGELAVRPAHVVESLLRRGVLRVELDDLGVGALGADEIVGRFVEHPGRAQEQRLLDLERRLVLSAEPLGGDVERLGHRGRIGAVLDGLLERIGRVRVVRSRDEQIDELGELLLGEVAARRAQGGRRPPQRLELVDHRRRVLRALRRVLGQQREDEVVDVRGDPPARRLGARGLGRRGDVRERGVGRRLEGEHRLAGEKLVHHRAEGVEVARRVRAMAAHLLGRDRLGRAEDGEDPGVPVGHRGSLPQPIGPEVDQRDVRAAVAVSDEDVLELQVSVRDACPVKGGQRLQDAPQDRPRVADVHRARSREPRAEGLGVDEVVAEPVGAVVFTGLEPLRQAGVVDRRHHAVCREEPLDRPLVPARLAPEDLERPPLFLARDRIDDRLPALAELSYHDERTELAAVRDLVLAEQPRDVREPRVHALPGHEDDVDQRVELISVDAPFGQRPGKARLARRAADLLGVEAEEALAHRGELIERVKSFELGAENVDRRIHGCTGQRGWSGHGSEARGLLDLHTTSRIGCHFRRRERVSLTQE